MPPVIQLATLQVTPRKGDYAANLERLGAAFAQLDSLAPRPHVALLPETALTGYFVEGGVGELAVTTGELVADLQRVYTGAVRDPARPLDVVVGYYERWEGLARNSAVYVTLGGREAAVRHVHRKNFLPTYGLFDEERFVERGHDIRAFDAGWGRAAMLICEDAWHSLSGTLAALDGADVVFILSAAPARGAWPREDAVPGPASVARWERLVRDIAEEHGVYVALANLAGSEGGKVFPGGSLVCGPRGDVRLRAPLWEEAIATLPLDLGDIGRARLDMPLISDLRTALPHLLGSLQAIAGGVAPRVAYAPAPEVDGAAAAEGRAANAAASVIPDGAPAASGADNASAAASGPSPGASGTSPAANGPLPVVCASRTSGEVPPLAIDGHLLEEWLTLFLRQELARRGFERAIVALSGGVDSAVTAYLAARAVGPERVIGLRLPYRTSSPESLAHAELVTGALGIASRTLDISAAVDGYLAAEPEASPARRGNVMARTRMIALFDLSARHAALPLGTGNKSERLLGYFTWHADDSPPVNPLGDLYKTQVWALARHLGIPEAIVAKPPSADLVTGQTDEGDIGLSYERADCILHWLTSGYSPADLEARGFEHAEVQLVHRRLEGTHWKRRLPTVAMVSGTAIGDSYLRPVDY